MDRFWNRDLIVTISKHVTSESRYSLIKSVKYAGLGPSGTL